MTPLEYTGPNAEQIQYWNEASGRKWVTLHNLIDTQLLPLGLRVMERARISPGERVLDVGCGCGSTTLGDQTVQFLLQMGPTGAAMRAAAADTLDAVTAAMREALQPYVTADGGLRMEAAAWIVTGQRGE
jgi:2-polyprenyl-3-methyl-5-hydroxy-6-metoxy-1,4-benzoquinol methylase